jgi:RNA polymerase sigma factor (sigma-70 family)
MTQNIQQFEALALPHLDAAYNLARWLLRDEVAAQDAVQESYLRAFRFFDRFRGEEMRPWLLAIVRNTCWTYLSTLSINPSVELEEEALSELHEDAYSPSMNPEQLLLAKWNRQQIYGAIEALPASYKEIWVLRELEELTYEDIARIVSIPIGTVMSRLSRARALLRGALVEVKGG